MSQTLTPDALAALREQVARIVLGPKSHWNTHMSTVHEMTLEAWGQYPEIVRAFAKADAILALPALAEALEGREAKDDRPLSEVVAELREIGKTVDWGADPVGDILRDRHADEDRLAAAERALADAQALLGEVAGALDAVCQPYLFLTGDALQAGILMEHGPPKPQAGAALIACRDLSARIRAKVAS